LDSGPADVESDDPGATGQPVAYRQRFSAGTTAEIDNASSLGRLHQLCDDLACFVLDFEQAISKGGEVSQICTVFDVQGVGAETALLGMDLGFGK